MLECKVHMILQHNVNTNCVALILYLAHDIVHICIVLTGVCAAAT